ncbi:MAG: hypothetical protein OEW12_02310, partial [Deltaproteobacteria bacterium]|nr:hypothetical protein [Deltaproteobacteria bacterium]
SRIYSRTQKFISSYRVVDQQSSADNKKYMVKLDIRINRVQLEESLKEISLPILGEKPKPVWLAYNREDPFLKEPPLKQAALNDLKQRLDLLNLDLAKEVELEPREAKALDEPYKDTPGRKKVLREKTDTPIMVLFVSFYLSAPGGWGGGDPSAMKAVFYQPSTGTPLAVFNQEFKGPLANPKAPLAVEGPVVKELIKPLISQIQPDRIQEPVLVEESSQRVMLAVKGLKSVYDQESFETDFFKTMPAFKNFVLYRLSPDTVTYSGPLGGSLESASQGLVGRKTGEFTISDVAVSGEGLSIAVTRMNVAKYEMPVPFPKSVRPKMVERLLEPFLLLPGREGLNPRFSEKEQNGLFDRANPVGLNAPIYGFLSARRDTDFYTVEAKPGQTVILTWERLGQTNLTPAVRVFDEHQDLSASYAPKKSLEARYTVPAGQSRFFIEVGDRFGYLVGDSGGYLNCHYILLVK